MSKKNKKKYGTGIFIAGILLIILNLFGENKFNYLGIYGLGLIIIGLNLLDG